MQKQELTFIVQAYNPHSKVWCNVFFAGCGIRQRKYAEALKQAQTVQEVMSKYGRTYRIIKKYLPLRPVKGIKQLQLI